jgi:ABC-type glutathione transport system ATPase component
MGTIVKDKKVSDMTAGELQDLIRKTIYETLDPDYGLELRPEVEEELRESIRQKERGEGIPLEDVKKQLGLE